MRRIVASTMFLLTLFGVADAGATTIFDPLERPGDPPRLLRAETVFVGTIDSVYGPDAWIRVAEVLHGTGIARRQPIHWGHGDVCEEVGARVLVLAGPPHGGELWCGLLRVEADGRLAGVRLTPLNSTLKASISGYPSSLYLPRKEAPQLSELRELDPRYRGKRTPAPFAPARSLDLVEVEALEPRPSDHVAFRLRTIGRILGPSAAPGILVRVSVPTDGGGSVLPAVGDSLLLPSTDGVPRLGFAARPGDFLVDRGFVSRLDVALEDVGDRIHRFGEGYVIVARGLPPAE